MRTLLRRTVDPTVRMLLRSPLHVLLSHRVMLVSFAGRRSGRRYTTPVQYVDGGACIYGLTSYPRRWWRNLRPSARVALTVKGEQVTGEACAASGR